MSDVGPESTTQTNAESARTRDRFPICALMQFIPMDVKGQLARSKALRIVGKDLSTTGIAFTHDATLPSRRAVVAASDPRSGRLYLEVEVLWSRLSPIGQYESGCRLVRKWTPGEFQRSVQADTGLNG
jgi:hypothetical protein